MIEAGRRSLKEVISPTRPRIRSYDNAVPTESVEQIVASFWPRFSNFIGLDPNTRGARNLHVHAKDPEGILNELRGLRDFSPLHYQLSLGVFAPLSKNVSVFSGPDLERTIAHELGHAGVQEVVGLAHLFETPKIDVNEAVAQSAEVLYGIWSSGQELDEFRSNLKDRKPGGGQIREIITNLGHPYRPHGLVKRMLTSNEEWNTSDIRDGLSYLFIYLLDTSDKQLFHKYLNSTSSISLPHVTKSALEVIYGKKMPQIKQEAIQWWYNE